MSVWNWTAALRPFPHHIKNMDEPRVSDTVEMQANDSNSKKALAG